MRSEWRRAADVTQRQMYACVVPPRVSQEYVKVVCAIMDVPIYDGNYIEVSSI